MSAPEWTVSPYVVGLLLDAPEHVANVLAQTFQDAERARRELGQHPAMPAGKSVHAVWVAYVARDARARGKTEAADWLDRAAVILTSDAGLDLENVLAVAARAAESD